MAKSASRGARRGTRTEAAIGKYATDPGFLCELVGTAVLVLVGCGAVVIGGGAGGALGIGLAFGIAVVAMAYTIGPVSGCHINPAVTASMWAAGRIRGADACAYIVAQLIGGIVGAGILVLLLKGRIAPFDPAAGLAQNGWGQGFAGGYGLYAAIGTEFVATFLFTLVILGATSRRGGTVLAGLVIGLTLVALHLAFINVTALSVNPARSLGPAVFVGGNALAQVWMFLVVPTIGGLVAGWLVKAGTLEI